MGLEAIKNKIEKLEELYGEKEPLIFIISHPDGSPPDVLICGDDTPEEEKAIRAQVLAKWRAKKGGHIPETDPVVLEARLALLEARIKGKRKENPA